ncbi:PTS system mannose-specific IIB component [Breznakia blatticola]|uniref:PTS system mannose-specific IIB component n=1 Tax=Breznakia blatticola TaxID=1754012 RepID=A0A4R7ZGD5_9FIRM|nr:PTS sugar transporter subunit IIB [Breznakia blatticola]TDW16743.1 PTS system mannose-specific IIB component [Breznakia blatticola]
MIKEVRIDHRLVHGQVAFTWTKFLGATRIIVIDNKAAHDDLQKMAINMAKPQGVKLNIFSVEEALSKMPKVEKLSDVIFMVFGNTKDCADFVEAYPKLPVINYGGITKKEGSAHVFEVVYLNPSELEDTKRILQHGTKVVMQQLPTTKREVLDVDSIKF